MIDKSKYSVAKKLELYLAKNLQIDFERIEFREGQHNKSILFIDNKEVNKQQLESCKKIFSEFEF